ncbi:hypothetical protein BBJ28_00017628 [Nothophytophthora sp. Chile5]|nr:hypothetical protein BBJ28_00017628 [Nothophytophthora sp. Chile5]
MRVIRGVLIDLSGSRVDNGRVLLYMCRMLHATAQISQLHRIGLVDINAQHVVTSGGIARSLLQERNLRPLLLIDPSLQEEFDEVDCTDPNAVVIGLAPEHFHYNKLNEAFRVLLAGGSLIALHEARYFAVRDGLNLGPGAFVKALEFSAGVQATIIGYLPRLRFGCNWVGRNVTPEEAVMIGDDVSQDVHGAMALGMHGVLVQTGKYRKGDEDQIGAYSWW